jgi:hypothetical protein
MLLGKLQNQQQPRTEHPDLGWVDKPHSDGTIS